MSLPRYEQYRDSGFQWLGEVPAHWDCVAVWLLFELGRGRVISHEEILAHPGAFPVYSSQTENNGEMGRIDTYDFDGDYLTWTTDGANAGTVFRRSGKFNCTNVCGTLRPKGKNLVLDYCLHSLGVSTASYVRQDINPKLMNNVIATIKILVPPVAEQSAIAAFLDHETAKIDALIAEQQRLIELLREKRQAVISHAVTKGLNPAAPMKSSGIEWLGDIPAHWKVGALKHFVRQKKGAIKTGPFGSQLTSAEMQSGTIRVYNQRSVIDCDFESGDNFISAEKFADLASFEAFPGDLLVTTRGTIGRVAIVPPTAEQGILHPCVLRIQPDTSVLSADFLRALIQDSDLMKVQLSYLSNATTIEVIYSDTMASVTIPVPPPHEQLEILVSLGHESTRIDALTDEAQSAITLLQERRTALISAAVTGKIDVRSQTERSTPPR